MSSIVRWAISRPAGADRLERGRERQRSGGDEGAVLAEAVAHHEVGHDAVGGEQAGEGEVDRQHGGLGDLGPAQVRLGRGDGVGVAGVDEQVGRQRTLDQRRHDGVGLVERRGDDRLDVAERRQHVGVLRALAGVEEGDLRRRAAAAEDAAPAQGLPAGRLREGGERLLGLVGELVGVGVVDGDALGGAQVGLARRGGGRGVPGHRLGVGLQQARLERGLVVGAEDQGAAQRRLGRPRRRPPVDRRCGRDQRRLGRRQLGAHRHDLLPVRGHVTGHVLLEHGVEVGAAEPEGAHAGGADAVGGRIPRTQLGVDGERGRSPVDVGVELLDVEAGRQLLVVDRHHRLEEAGGSGGGLQVADVRLGRADRHRSRAEVGAAERLADARHLDDVADARRRAVALDHPARLGGQPGVAPSPLHRQPLTDRIGRGDPLAPPVAGATDAAQHGVDAVAVALGVGEPLEHEHAGALTHHEAVGAGVERPCAGGREGADLAELDEARGAHVAVDATGDGGVVVSG